MKRGPKGPIRGTGARLAIAAAASLSLLMGTSADAAPPPRGLCGRAVHERQARRRAPSPGLRAPGPHRRAVRPDRALPLRGRDELFSRTPPADAKWLVRGAFAAAVGRQGRDYGRGGARGVSRRGRGHATRTGSRDGLATIALDAAAAAFATLPGAPPTTEALAAARAPFNRDSYSFTLYGRAVAAFHGGGGVTRPTPRRQAARGPRDPSSCGIRCSSIPRFPRCAGSWRPPCWRRRRPRRPARC